MNYVKIAKILNTFGIRGELKLESYTDFADERFKTDSYVYIGEDKEKFSVKAFREHKGFILLSLNDHEDINLVEKYKGQDIYKALEDIPALPEGEYYFRDLKGLDVYVEEEKIGKVINVEEGVSSNYIRVLKDEDKKEYLVPFLPPFIEKTDLEKGRIDVVKMEGLL